MGYAKSSPIVRQLRIDCGASVYRWVVVLFVYRYLQGCKGRQNRNQVEIAKKGSIDRLLVLEEMKTESGYFG